METHIKASKSTGMWATKILLVHQLISVFLCLANVAILNTTFRKKITDKRSFKIPDKPCRLWVCICSLMLSGELFTKFERRFLIVLRNALYFVSWLDISKPSSGFLIMNITVHRLIAILLKIYRECMMFNL